ncbi:MAG TPA: hypothetical protein VGA78_06925 [Gemmatimonadales bacterium]|jgi:uncharacterized protein YoxC
MLPSLHSALAAVVQAAWVGPTVAISLVLIALGFGAVAVALVVVGKNLVDLLQSLEKEVAELREELAPAIKSVQGLAEEGQGLANKVQQEIQDVVRTSQRIRFDVERGMRRAKQRLSDLDALAEVMQEEIEETALDVAAKLRSVRRGLGVVSRLRRFVGGGRRKRVREG